MFEMVSIKRLNSLELLAVNEAHFSNSWHFFLDRSAVFNSKRGEMNE